MNKALPLLLLASVMAAPATALELQAQPNTFDYDYLDAGFVNYDNGGSGIYLQGSIDTYPNVNLLAGFSAADNYIEFRVGTGYHQAIPTLTNTDMVFSAGLERGEFDVGAGTIDDSDTGVFLSAGLRASATPTLELYSNLTYHSFFSGDLGLDAGLRLQINDKLDLTVGGQLSDNDAFMIGARYYY